MIAASAERLERQLEPNHQVLDVGGWNKPLTRADWVIDLMPYATRSPAEGSGDERFTADTWVQRDICDHEPWPFSDDQFDFAICSHVLEDVRDPVWVCHELNRVPRPATSRFRPASRSTVCGSTVSWAGWSHHHWLIDMGEESIDFVFKPHSINGWPPLPPARAVRDAPHRRRAGAILWWEGGFAYRERIFFDLLEFDAYMADFVADWKARLEPRLPGGARWRQRAGRIRRRLRRPG